MYNNIKKELVCWNDKMRNSIFFDEWVNLHQLKYLLVEFREKFLKTFGKIYNWRTILNYINFSYNILQEYRSQFTLRNMAWFNINIPISTSLTDYLLINKWFNINLLMHLRKAQDFSSCAIYRCSSWTLFSFEIFRAHSANNRLCSISIIWPCPFARVG